MCWYKIERRCYIKNIAVIIFSNKLYHLTSKRTFYVNFVCLYKITLYLFATFRFLSTSCSQPGLSNISWISWKSFSPKVSWQLQLCVLSRICCKSWIPSQSWIPKQSWIPRKSWISCKSWLSSELRISRRSRYSTKPGLPCQSGTVPTVPTNTWDARCIWSKSALWRRLFYWIRCSTSSVYYGRWVPTAM